MVSKSISQVGIKLHDPNFPLRPLSISSALYRSLLAITPASIPVVRTPLDSKVDKAELVLPQGRNLTRTLISQNGHA